MNIIAPLSRLDALASDHSHFSFVEPSQLEPGGIDPLGMGAINLELLHAALPGINNQTFRIRAYAFTAWAWWRARECMAAQSSGMVDARDLQALVDRWEILFVWSNMLAGTNSGMPGRIKLGGSLPASGDFALHGAKWNKLRAERHSGQTALQSAVAYGPSMKALLWITAHEKGAFSPSEQVMPVVQAFDDAVTSVLPPALLQSGPVSISVEEVAALHAAWNADAPTTIEQEAFQRLFYGIGIDGTADGNHRLRAETIGLFREALKQASGLVSEGDIRRILASQRFAGGSEFRPADILRERSMLWSAVQARELQRQALEGLFSWIEEFIDTLDGVADAEAMVEAADKAARDGEEGADAECLGTYLDQAAARAGTSGWPAACAWHEATDIFRLMDALGEAVSKEDWPLVPPLALRAIAYVDAMVTGLRALGIETCKPNPLAGNPDRLPLATASKRLAFLRDKPMRELWREIILSWVLAQHVRWSVVRNGDGKQRLRVTLDEGGWVRLRQDTRTIEPMRDRLSTSLSLAAECGLIARVRDAQGQAAYSPA